MIYSNEFVWLHFPKCAGTKIERLFLKYFSDENKIVQDIVNIKLDPLVTWHDTIDKREKRDINFKLGSRVIIFPIRRLPFWLESRYNYEFSRSPHLSNTPEILLKGNFLNQNGNIENANETIKYYLPEHLIKSNKIEFIRVEYFEEDFKKVFGKYIDVSKIPDTEFFRKENTSKNCIPEIIRQKLHDSENNLYELCPYWKMVEEMAYSETSKDNIPSTYKDMKKIVLHIGTHKTGTTAIQKFASDQSDFLQKNDIFYPVVGRPTREDGSLGVAQHLIPWLIIGGAKDEAYLWGNFKNRIQELWPCFLDHILNHSASRILISSEEFDVLTLKQIKELHKKFEPFDVTIICYLRRLDQFVQTMYASEVSAANGKRSINKFLEKPRTPLDYDDLINRWRSVFGKNKVIVKLYSDNLLKNNDVVQDFFETIGVDIADMRKKSTPERVNKGLPWNVISVLRVFNKLNIPKKYTYQFINIMNLIYQKETVSHTILPPSQRKLMAEKCAKQIESLNLPNINNEILEKFLFDEFESEDVWKKLHEGTYSGLALTLSDIHKILKEHNNCTVNVENKKIQARLPINDRQADVFREQGIVAIKKNDWSHALEKLKLAHAIRPYGSVIRLQLIHCLVQLKRFDEAILHFDFLSNPPANIRNNVSLNHLLNNLYRIVRIAKNFDSVRSTIRDNKNNIHKFVSSFYQLKKINLIELEKTLNQFINNAEQQLVLNPSQNLNQNIPKKSHRIWLTNSNEPCEPPSDFIERYLNNISKAYPSDWEHYFWIQDERLLPKTIELIRSKNISNLYIKHFKDELTPGNWNNLIDAFLKNKKFVFASDILRMKILDEWGGVYCDLGVNFIPGYIDYLITVYDHIFIFWNTLFFQNGLLAMRPKSDLSLAFMKLTENPYLMPKELIMKGNHIGEAGIFTGPTLTLLILSIFFKKNNLKLCLLNPFHNLITVQTNQSWYKKNPDGTAKFGNTIGGEPSFMNKQGWEEYSGPSIFDLIELI